MTPWQHIVASIGTQPAPYKPKAKELLPEKKCTSCGIVKQRSEFYHRADHSPNSLMSRCKECVINSRKRRRAEEKAKYKIGDNSFDRIAKFEFPD